MNRAALRRFLKLYFFRLNNGLPAGMRANISNQPAVQKKFLSQKKDRWYINLALFVITLCTTTLAGAVNTDGILNTIISGLPYSVTLMTILGVHEFGHYFAARRFGIKATLPFFIPFPSIVGTMGAVIKTKSPIPHRRALFYVGVMGPLPGFAVSLAAVIAGIMFSQILPLPPKDGLTPIFGNSLLFSMIVYIFHGTIPAGYDIALHPIAWAGWIGFLVTSLNLIPIGQLDGGHILYSLIGRKQVYAGWVSFAGLLCLSFVWPGWGVWIFMTLFIFMVAHPKVPDAGLSLKEKAAGWFCMVVLVITFIPVPVTIY